MITVSSSVQFPCAGTIDGHLVVDCLLKIAALFMDKPSKNNNDIGTFFDDHRIRLVCCNSAQKLSHFLISAHSNACRIGCRTKGLISPKAYAFCRFSDHLNFPYCQLSHFDHVADKFAAFQMAFICQELTERGICPKDIFHLAA